MASNNFYLLDQRCGSAVTINGKSAYGLFNADLKEMRSVPGVITSDFQKMLGYSGLSISSYTIEVGGLEMVFYVGGATKQECYLHTSNLVAECKNCIIKTDEDSFEYVAVLTAFSPVETGVKFYNEVTLTFSVIKRLPLITHTFVGGNGVFKNIGSIESGMKITITPTTTIAIFTINGINVTNLTTGIPFVIDGLVGEIKANGINRFLDTDLIEFPKVQPGDNEIVVSNTNCTVEVSYYPTFIV